MSTIKSTKQLLRSFSKKNSDEYSDSNPHPSDVLPLVHTRPPFQQFFVSLKVRVYAMATQCLREPKRTLAAFWYVPEHEQVAKSPTNSKHQQSCTGNPALDLGYTSQSISQCRRGHLKPFFHF